ncbi:unnamed protein product [Cylicocyclus nassatus]|uniref:Uncharacterized protein n=1 Tax=Cylicocyclus nassatus TaxID=53992 RepID=A0AA36GKB4_CYLNA|nr:unnamed protein product [Cylicocyclus nassatus]
MDSALCNQSEAFIHLHDDNDDTLKFVLPCSAPEYYDPGRDITGINCNKLENQASISRKSLTQAIRNISHKSYLTSVILGMNRMLIIVVLTISLALPATTQWGFGYPFGMGYGWGMPFGYGFGYQNPIAGALRGAFLGTMMGALSGKKK